MCWILICKPNKEGRGQGSYSMSNTHFAIAALRCCCCCCFYLCCRCTSSDQVSHQIEQRAQHAAINAGTIRCSAFFVARLVGQSLCRSVSLCCVCGCKVPAEKQKSGSNLFKLPVGKENKHSAVCCGYNKRSSN